jgi:DNA-binding Lrp family transcriptional regulator
VGFHDESVDDREEGGDLAVDGPAVGEGDVAEVAFGESSSVVDDLLHVEAQLGGVGPDEFDLNRLLDDGSVRVAVTPAVSPGQDVMLLRIRVLSGEVGQLTQALARRDDIPFIDVSAGGDQVSAVLVAEQGTAGRLVFRQLPATSAVTAVEAQPVIHVFSGSGDWRIDDLTPAERAGLTPERSGGPALAAPLDGVDQVIADQLAVRPRATAAAIAGETGLPGSTVRRRLADLLRSRRVVLQTFVDPRRLGLNVDASLWLRVPPARLDAAGRALAAHPAVHGALATAGSFNLHAAVWLRDLAHLYEFTTTALADLGAEQVDTVVVGTPVKRPGH